MTRSSGAGGPRSRRAGSIGIRCGPAMAPSSSGLRWLCVMLLAPIPWAGCVWALPFLTMLAPSERYATERGHRHKKLTDWARQGLLQTVRWLPGRRVIAVGDSSFSAIELLRDVGRHLCMISRLRLDAGLYEPA